MRALTQTLLLCLIVTQLHAQCQQEDYLALRALYLNASGDSWINNDGWLDSLQFVNNPTIPGGIDVGTWFGVTTTGGCVTELNLAFNQLIGSISPELGNLSSLTKLDLSHNEFTGSIPPELGNLTSLVELWLWQSHLSGNIPPELGNLDNLTKLILGFNNDFNGNGLSGNIPIELSDLSNLAELNLYGNLLIGEIPPELGDLSNLTILDLGVNQLTGSIPPQLGNLTSLMELRTFNNQLSGCYDSNLLNLCTQLAVNFNTNAAISDGNNFDAPWEDFCDTGIDTCPPCELIATSTSTNILCFDLDPWYYWNCEINPSSANAHIEVINPGTEPWHVGFSQADLLIEEDTTYVITFDAYTNGTPRDISVKAGLAVYPFTNYHWYTITINSTPQTFTETFEMSDTITTMGALEFYLGGNTGDVILDNIRFEEQSCVQSPGCNMITNGTFDTDGAIDLTIINGTEPYTYDWDNDGIGDNDDPEDLTDLPVGTYSVTITDADGCTETSSATITQAPLQITSTPTFVSAPGAQDGAISICVQGGTPNYTITAASGITLTQVSGTCDANFEANALAAGTYMFDIVDENACTESVEVIINTLDFVLPGDFNNDSIADANDLLFWGLTYGHTGPLRPDAATDWIPQYCPDWDDYVSDVNSKHQDANGDSIVDALDVEILDLNYGATYGDSPYTYEPNSEMFIVETLEVDIDAEQIRLGIGISSDALVSIHGVSTTIDLSNIDYDNFEIDTTDSSLDPDAFIYKENGGKIDIALTRTDRIDKTIDGPVFYLVVMTDDIQGLSPPINTEGGYKMSVENGLSSIGGSSLYGPVDAPISLGLNHVYCDEKGTAEVYVADAPDYSCVWNTEEITTSIQSLNIDSYSVTVNDGLGTTTDIDFDITWDFAPLTIHTDSNKIYIDFEEAPLSEEVEISLDGGYGYMLPTTEDVNYSLSNGDYEVFIQRVTDECPTYLIDSIRVTNEFPEKESISAYLINSLGNTPRLVYELDKSGTVDIRLYSIHQQLRTIYKTKSTEGKYQIDIDKGNLPKGIYFIQIRHESDDDIRTKTLKIVI